MWGTKRIFFIKYIYYLRLFQFFHNSLNLFIKARNSLLNIPIYSRQYEKSFRINVGKQFTLYLNFFFLSISHSHYTYFDSLRRFTCQRILRYKGFRQSQKHRERYYFIACSAIPMHNPTWWRKKRRRENYMYMYSYK